MPSQIRPNRLEVSDRFPMLGFTIRTDGEGKRYEVAIASDPALFQPDSKARRNRSNFYSSRGVGIQPIDRGEAVYVLPAEILTRFVGQEKLYYAVATYRNGNNSTPEIPSMPSQGTPYVNLKGLTGRSLRRVRILPSRQRAASSDSNGAGNELEWGGDTITPGTQAAAPSNGTAKSAPPANGSTQPASPNGAQAAAFDYNDGFGPLPPAGKWSKPRLPARSGARALDDDIPLDPGSGGMSIDASVLQIGDIILSTTDAAVSGLIRFGTGSQVSHAMLFVGQGGQVIESVGSGVRFVPLEQAIGPATLAVAFRVSDLSDDQRQQIADAAAGYIGQPYNRIGIVRQALFQVHSSVCRFMPGDLQDRCRSFVGSIDLGTSQGGEFFCSEMILAAYQATGFPLTTTPPNWNSPEDLAQLAMRSGALAYVGHLKAPPYVRSRSLREILGLSLGADGACEDLLAQARRLGVADIVQQLIAQGAHADELRRLLGMFSRPPGTQPPATSSGLALAMPVPTDQAQPARLPRARAASTLESAAIEAALGLLAGPFAPLIAALRAVAGSQGVSVGIGPSAGAGFGLGMGAGAGVIFASDGTLGVYGQLDIRAGLIDSASVGIQVTIVRGGIDAFNEVGLAVGGAFVEGVEVTVQVLFNTALQFRGVSFEVGAGLSVEPIEVFAAIEGSISQTVGGAAPMALAASQRMRNGRRPLSRPMTIALPIPTDQARRITPAPARQLSTAERFAMEAVLAVLPPPISTAIQMARSLAGAGGYSVAIGPAGSVNFLLGIGVGFAVVFGPGGTIGVMGSLEIRGGALDSLAGGIRIALVRGNIESFNEVTLAVGGAFVEGVDITVEVLFTTDFTFRGVSFELGVGISAEPFEVFGAIEGSLSQQVSGGAMALSNGGRFALPRRYARPQSFDAGPLPLDQAVPVSMPPIQEPSALVRGAISGMSSMLGPASNALDYLRGLIDRENIAIAVGFDASVHAQILEWLGIGVSTGGGVIFAPGGRIGIYAGQAFRVGNLANSSSVGIQVSIVRAGIDGFNEVGFAVGATIGGEPDFTVQALLTSNLSFKGISVGFGVGVPSGEGTWQVFLALENSRATQIAGGQSLALGAASSSRRRREPARWSRPQGVTALDAPSDGRPIQWPQAHGASVVERAIIEGLLAFSGPMGAWVNVLRGLAEASGLSVAVGPAATSGLGQGTSVSFGVIFAPGSRLGIYGSVTSLQGFVAGISAVGRVTVVRGDIESFNELGWAAGVSVEVEGVEVGAESLFAAGNTFRGISVDLGVGVGSPIQIYRAVEQLSLAGQVAGSQALAAAAAAGSRSTFARAKSASSGQLAPPPPPVYGARSLDAGAAEAAIAIAGIAIEHVISNETSITWDLDQWRGMKHPNDTPPSPASPFQDAPPIMLNRWPVVEGASGDEISAWFQVDWQYNGKSLGNIRIRNTGTNNALLRRAHVDARIMDDNIVYPRDNPTFAALRITFTYRFTRPLLPDSIATTEVHLYGDGHIDVNGRWDQE